MFILGCIHSACCSQKRLRPKVKLNQGSLTWKATLSPKAVQSFGYYYTIQMFLTFSLTVNIAQVKVSIDKRGPIVEVLGHVVQPVGLHPFDPVVAVLDLQRYLDCVVLHVSVPDRRVVVKSQQLCSCWDATEKNIQSQKMGFRSHLSLTGTRLRPT